MGKEVTIPQVEVIIKELNLPNGLLSIDYPTFKKIILIDPMVALKERGDLHPLFVLEEEEEND